MTLCARSLLYVPGNREKMLQKAAASGADALILDLEDAVPADRKAEARGLVAAALPELSQQIPCLVRINDLDQNLVDEDLDAVVRPGLTAVVQPKVRTPADIIRLCQCLTSWEARRGLTPGAIGIIPIMETALGIHHTFAIGQASPRIAAVVFAGGKAGDLAAELGYQWTLEGTERLYARSRVLVESRAAGVQWLLDGVYFDPADTAGLRTEAENSRRLGYQGKTIIHPAQAAVVNDVFTPGAAEVEAARETIAALSSAEAAGAGTLLVKGQLVDIASVRRARAVLALAELIERRGAHGA